MRISDWSSDVCSSDLEVIGLTGLDERMTFLSEAQIFLLVEPLRLDAGNKARIDADGDIDMPGLERAHHFIAARSEEHTSELQSLMRIPYAVFCLTNKNKDTKNIYYNP